MVAVVLATSPVPGPVAAQTRGAAPRDPAIAEIVRAEQALLTAMVARDRGTLERLLAPQFVLVSALSSGEVIPRAEWIGGLLDRSGTDDGRLADPEVRVHAPGVATVVARIDWTPAGTGATSPREQYVVTDTWVRRGRTWQLAARHSSARRPAP